MPIVYWLCVATELRIAIFPDRVSGIDEIANDKTAANRPRRIHSRPERRFPGLPPTVLGLETPAATISSNLLCTLEVVSRYRSLSPDFFLLSRVLA